MASHNNGNQNHNQPPPNAYRSHAPPNLDLNLQLGQPLDAAEAYVRTPPRAAYQYRPEEDDLETTPSAPHFQRDGGDYISTGPTPERGRECVVTDDRFISPGHASYSYFSSLFVACSVYRPSIDETHRNFAYRAQPSMTSLNQSTSTTGGLPDHLNPNPSQTNLHRVFTNESHHSRSPLTTPHIDSQAAFQGQSYMNQQQPSIRPVKENDYAPQVRKDQGTTYPPGQYHSIPLSDSMGEKSTMDERGRKRGIAWGGVDRWSKSGTKEGEPASHSSEIDRWAFAKLYRLLAVGRGGPRHAGPQPELGLLPWFSPSISFQAFLHVPRCVWAHGRSCSWRDRDLDTSK